MTENWDDNSKSESMETERHIERYYQEEEDS